MKNRCIGNNTTKTLHVQECTANWKPGSADGLVGQNLEM